MSLSKQQKKKAVACICNALRKKLAGYNPKKKEALNPFQVRLLGKDRMALFRFIHSLNTSMGISIYEPVAEMVAKEFFAEVLLQYTVGKRASASALSEADKIVDELAVAKNKKPPSHDKEIARIKKARKVGSTREIRTVKADLFMRHRDGRVFLVDIKTAHPNLSNFRDFKRTLLHWSALMLEREPNVRVNAIIGIPYNPHEPNPYQERWTLAGMLDVEKQLLVGKDFWNFLAGGKNIYSDLLDCFEAAGNEMRKEIDAYFAKISGGEK